jgi:hypothetical protein
MGTEVDSRGNAVVGGVIVLLLVAVMASVLGLVLFDTGAASNSLGTNETATATPAATMTATATATPEPRNVTVRFETQGEHVMAMATGGEDLDAVESFSVTGANMTTTMDPDEDTPRTYGSADRPTTVRVTATFEDGSTQVVGEKRLD